MSEELLFKAYSVSVIIWKTSNMWDEFLLALETVLQDRLVRLDVNDPIRRKVDSVRGAGDYITAFEPLSNSCETRGVFEKSRVWFCARVSRELDGWGNRFNLYLPLKWVDKVGPERLSEAFEICCSFLDPFYAIGDLEKVIYSQKSSTPGATLTYYTEFSGVNWLTFFGDAYVAYFGGEKFAAFPRQRAVGGGLALRLADHYANVTDEMRRAAEQQIGPLAFTSFGANKKAGEFVMTYPQIESRQNELRKA